MYDQLQLLLQEVVAGFTASLGLSHPDTLAAKMTLAGLLLDDPGEWEVRIARPTCLSQH